MSDEEATDHRPARADGVTTRQRRHRLRSGLSAVLITLACVLTPLSIVASWTSGVVGDTDRYVAMVGPLAANPAVQNAIAAHASRAVAKHLDAATLLEQVPAAERPAAQRLIDRFGPAVNSALADFVQRKTQDVVASPWFESFWTQANRGVHAAVVKALTGQGGDSVRLTDDGVVIDAGPVVDRVKQRLVDDGVTAAGKVPEVHTEVTVLSGQHIRQARTGFRYLQLLGDWLSVIAAAIAAVGVWLAARRRRALIAAAFGVAAGALVLGIGLTVGRGLYLDRLPVGVDRSAAGAVYDQLVLFLRTAVRAVVVLGVAVGLGVWLAGPGRRASRVRGLATAGIDATSGAAAAAGMRLGPVAPFVHRYRGWLAALVLAVGGLTLALWSYPTGWVVFWIVVLDLLALAVLRFLGTPDEESGHSPQQQ